MGKSFATVVERFSLKFVLVEKYNNKKRLTWTKETAMTISAQVKTSLVHIARL